MIDLYDKLNQRIYDNCKIYYDLYKDGNIDDYQKGILCGLYQAMNIVANDYLMNHSEEHQKYRDMANKLEEMM